jgi:hypothetical protein
MDTNGSETPETLELQESPEVPTADEIATGPETAASQEGREAPGGPTLPDGPEREVASRAGANAPRVEVDYAEGDLVVHGSDLPHVRVNGLESDRMGAPAEADGGALRFAHLPDGAELLVPWGAAVTVREVAGDLRADGLQGELMVGRVAGDTELEEVAAVDLGRVEGDLRATVGDRLRVREVGGDARVEGMRGAPTLGRIAGDLEVRGVAGLEAREAVGGDATLEGCAGDAYLRGPVGGGLRVDGCAGTLHVGSVAGGLRLRMGGALGVDGAVGGNCEVAEVAGAVSLHGSVGGTLRASLVGELAVTGAVGGDADLATVVRATSLRTVGGDLTTEALAGPLTVGTVGGDARLRTCLGAATISLVGGDLLVVRATGGVAMARVGGDAVLDTPLAAGAEYQVRAAGDVSLRVRGEVNARFVAQALGGEVRTRLPLAVERGRRRNLVGVLGRGDATVTLHSDGGDILIAAAGNDEEETMGDEFVGGGTGAGPTQGGTGTGTGTDSSQRNWEGSFGGHRFRVHWDPGAPGAGVEDPDGVGAARRGLKFEWEHNPERDHEAREDFERRMDDLREKAERLARRAAEQAQRYAERAARRARETDWEAVGREVRSAIERAMADLEDAVGQVRRDYSSRRSPGGPPPGPRPSGAQRVRIEQEEEGDAFASGYGTTAAYGPPPSGAGAPKTDMEARRRAILEQLRAGTISLDEAERQLGELR